jgi:hypothetical protein
VVGVQGYQRIVTGAGGRRRRGRARIRGRFAGGGSVGVDGTSAVLPKLPVPNAAGP